MTSLAIARGMGNGTGPATHALQAIVLRAVYMQLGRENGPAASRRSVAAVAGGPDTETTPVAGARQPVLDDVAGGAFAEQLEKLHLAEPLRHLAMLGPGLLSDGHVRPNRRRNAALLVVRDAQSWLVQLSQSNESRAGNASGDEDSAIGQECSLRIVACGGH